MFWESNQRRLWINFLSRNSGENFCKLNVKIAKFGNLLRNYLTTRINFHEWDISRRQKLASLCKQTYRIEKDLKGITNQKMIIPHNQDNHEWNWKKYILAYKSENLACIHRFQKTKKKHYLQTTMAIFFFLGSHLSL